MSDDAKRMILVKQCTGGVTEDNIKDYYATLGVQSVRIAKRPKNKSFAFVTFKTEKKAAKALAMPPATLDGVTTLVMPLGENTRVFKPEDEKKETKDAPKEGQPKVPSKRRKRSREVLKEKKKKQQEEWVASPKSSEGWTEGGDEDEDKWKKLKKKKAEQNSQKDKKNAKQDEAQDDAGGCEAWEQANPEPEPEPEAKRVKKDTKPKKEAKKEATPAPISAPALTPIKKEKEEPSRKRTRTVFDDEGAAGNTVEVDNESIAKQQEKGKKKAEELAQQKDEEEDDGVDYEALNVPTNEDPVARTIFLRRCPQSIEDHHIRTFYKWFGTPEIRWARAKGRFRGFGFVTFKSVAQMEHALAKGPPTVDGKELVVSKVEGKTWEEIARGEQSPQPVEPAAKKKKKQQTETTSAGGASNRTTFDNGIGGVAKGTEVFFGRCPDSISNDHFLNHYKEMGEGAVTGIRWAMQANQFRGFCFVNFSTAEQAEEATYNPPTVDRRVLEAQLAGQKSAGFDLFMGALPETTKATEVQEYYTKALGKDSVSRVRLFTTPDGWSKGYGFIGFATQELADKAMAMDRPVFGGYSMRLERPGEKAPREAPKGGQGGAALGKEISLFGCPEGITDEDIRDHYKPLGDKAITKINWTRKGHIAFITFLSKELRTKALEMPAPVIDFTPLEAKAAEEGRY